MKTKNGYAVFDRFNTHVKDSVRPILERALAQVDTKDLDFVVEEVDMGEIVGESTCVETTHADLPHIVYAKRPKRFGYTRFVKNRKPETSQYVVVILKKKETPQSDDPVYVLITAFIGRKAQPEPWDRAATSQSREFWDTHALVWGSEPVDETTVTTVCPW